MTDRTDDEKRNRDWNGRILALISLLVALSSLAYNTWRNETTEAHRNIRQAAFAMLEQSGQLQQIVDNRFYAGDRSEMTRIAAWGKVALLRDLGSLMPPQTERDAQHLFELWSKRSADIDHGDAQAEAEISKALKELRRQAISDLHSLH